MSVESVAIDALTAQNTGLFEVCVSLKDNVAQLIADAVVVSENAAIVPMMSMTANLIDMQALLVTHLTAKPHHDA